MMPFFTHLKFSNKCLQDLCDTQQKEREEQFLEKAKGEKWRATWRANNIKVDFMVELKSKVTY